MQIVGRITFLCPEAAAGTVDMVFPGGMPINCRRLIYVHFLPAIPPRSHHRGDENSKVYILEHAVDLSPSIQNLPTYFTHHLSFSFVILQSRDLLEGRKIPGKDLPQEAQVDARGQGDRARGHWCWATWTTAQCRAVWQNQEAENGSRAGVEAQAQKLMLRAKPQSEDQSRGQIYSMRAWLSDRDDSYGGVSVCPVRCCTILKKWQWSCCSTY